MKRLIIKIGFLFLVTMTCSSCNKWLEIQPEDRFTEEQVFSNQQGFEDTMNGIYLRISGNSLYGDNLTLSLLDVLAQSYMVSSSIGPFKEVISYNYADKGVRARFDGIWNEAYTSIANINQLLVNLDRYSQNIPVHRAKIMKGELLGLRALLHFDLLKLYGPVYNSADSTDLSIPYYHKLGPEIGRFQPANKVMDFILSDIKAAEENLAADAIKTEGNSNYLNKYRFNYYANKALAARVYLWRNDKPNALKSAKEVIAASNLFPWVSAANITADFQSPDRIFSTELLFSVFTKDLYTNYNRLFYYELVTSDILATGSSAYLNDIYDNNSNDYRKDYIWKVPPLGVPFPAFFKYADVVDKKKNFRNTIPVIRLSEMYYIAAEAEPNAATALDYINTVRNHRGIPSLTTITSIDQEIRKEYIKEFYGEGQLWYYYKRKQITSVVSPNSNTTVSIPVNAFMFIMPDSEISNR
ncbi:MAG: RagB/SusD family nutrient uptake outer membrane protein [Candidatus Pedobacter colombiensis]|uniref:RagB/SusD family nutrient uptake outer membrane protein n=1 Tax=Candidatus Pedobacter colombiensis TaxID=3121371 RepID=A0AAJ6B6Z9_9SPHI|nr:RagB/SusD family nutrient uptake outer membrane protein [Pedobacter sp.]WEK18991.1 MAG: RagB/SusD family nutrient uptake outer membrane protein [Pedobacter sp.]